MKTIEVLISPTGESVITSKGYSGSDCLKATKALEQALGVVASDRKTAEYHQAQAQTQENQA